MAVCEVCGLPKELCVCEAIAREAQKIIIYTAKRTFGKLMTVIEGLDEKGTDLKNLLKTLKTECACGGTFKDGKIELQGDHKEKVRKMLLRIGFSDDLIEVK